MVLPGCWWLTAHQVEVLVDYLDAGGRVVLTDDPATNQPAGLTQRLVGHPNTSRAELTDVAALQPDPQVRLSAALTVNLQRVPETQAVAVHLIDHAYDAEIDAVPGHRNVQVATRLDEDLLMISTATVWRPGRQPETVPVRRRGDHLELTLPETGIYTIVVLDAERTGSA